jgi:hypothetical protein
LTAWRKEVLETGWQSMTQVPARTGSKSM